MVNHLFASSTAGNNITSSIFLMNLTRRTELSTSVLSGDSSVWRWRRMCLRALCTMLETDSLEMGTAAAGSVSLDKAELMSLFSAGGGGTQQLLVITPPSSYHNAINSTVNRQGPDLYPPLQAFLSQEPLLWTPFCRTA